MEERVKENPLGTAPLGGLVAKFAIPSIIAMVVGAIYNIVDQIFIGQYVGNLGNAATNISFPLTAACVSIALLFGIGGASNFNLAMGRKQYSDAAYYIGNGLSGLVFVGTLLFIVTEVFLEPILTLFGATETIMPFAVEYVRILAIGFPFVILMTGGGHIIRADGSPRIAMFCNLSGAFLNVVLDAILVPQMGMQGAALATIIGQIISAIIVVVYVRHYKTVELKLSHCIPKAKYVSKICSLGVASFFNQIAIMVTQIALNNALKIYGAMSVYGSDIPIAAAGVILKIFQLFFAVVIGIVQGSQPIFGYNFGAKKYDRVKKAYKLDLFAGFAVSLIGFILFQTIPRQLLALFGEGSEAYFEFGERFFRIYMMGMLINFMQPITATFFPSIGNAYKGVFLSLTRQIIYLLPLIIVLPMIWGIDGLVLAGPIADVLAFITAIIMALVQIRQINRLQSGEEVDVY